MTDSSQDRTGRCSAAGDHEVVVVGGGPVGLTAALALGRRGISVLVLERDADFCEGSRAICISRRSLQILDRLGVGAAFMAKGLGWTSGTSYLDEKEVFRLEMPMGADDRFPPFINLQQYYAERFVFDGLDGMDHVEVRWQAEATGIENLGERTRLHWREGGRDMHIDARWIIACDGARSTMRRLLGLKMEGEAYDKQYLIADIEIDLPWPTARKVWFDPPSNRRSTVIMHRQPDNVWRLDYQLLPEEDPDRAIEEDNVRARIQRHLRTIGFGDKDWTLLWRSLYRAHCLSLPDYRTGGVFFAGDAAHLVPIFGVRGMNSGIEDADNLAWKLAMVAGVAGNDALLDTYSVERRGAYEDNIAAARKSTWFMSPPSPGMAIARDAVLELATYETGLRGLINPRQASTHRYRSPAIITDPSRSSEWTGWPLPDIRTDSGEDLHRLMGPDFTGLFVEQDAGGIAAEEIGDGDRPSLRLVTVPEGRGVAAALEASAGTLIVVRPDDHIALCRRGLERKHAIETFRRACRTVLTGGQSVEEVTHG